MLVLVNGIPYFAERMSDDFNEFDKGNRYVYCNTYYSRWAQLKYLFLLPFAGAVISVNGVAERSKSLDWALKLKKKLLLYWQGTDVQTAVNLTRSGKIYRAYIDYAAHLGVAPWFVDELGSIGVKVTYAPYAHVEVIGNDKVYSDVRILSYLAKNAEKFYGWEYIRAIALKRPDIGITIVGSQGEGLDAPENVTFKGWVSAEEMNELFRSHAIFARMTEHDGKALTVAQALSAGSEVIWTYPFEHCYHVNHDVDQFIETIESLDRKIRERGLRPNQENLAFARGAFERNAVLSSLVKEIKQILDGK